MTVIRFSLLMVSIALFFASCAVTLDRSSFLQEYQSSRSDSLRKEIAMDRFLNGTIEEETGEVWKAAVNYQIAMILDSTSSTIPVSLAKLYLKLGEQEAALLVLQKNYMKFPQDEETLHLLSQISTRSGNYRKAVSLNRKLAEIRSLNGSELLQQAEMLIQLRNLAGALDVFTEYLARFTPSASVYRKIGQIHVFQDNYVYADTAFRKLLELEPENHREAFMVGIWALYHDDFEVAEEYLRLAVLHDSTEYKYWNNLLISMSLQKKFQEHVETVNIAITLFPDSSNLYDLKANSLVRLGFLDSAQTCIEESIRLNENRTGPYLILGDIHHRREDWENGIIVFENALSIEPDNPTVLNNYAYMLAEMNTELDKAMEMVLLALEIEPDNASYLDTKGWIYFRKLQYKKALRFVKQAEKISLRENSSSAEVYDHLGHIYSALGKIEDANKAWQKAAELEPENEKYRRFSK